MDYTNIFLSILSKPEVIQYIITSLFSIGFFLYNYRNLIYKKEYKKLLEIAIEKSQEAVLSELNNDEKRDFVISELEKFIPEKKKKIFSHNTLIKISNKAYHEFVKEKNVQ